MKLTTGQWLTILIGMLAATAGASAQLSPVFGDGSAHLIVSVANLVMTVVVTPILFVVTGQKNIVQTVQDMPGIDSIRVNRNASAALAQLAIDPAQPKIEASPGQEAGVNTAATK